MNSFIPNALIFITLFHFISSSIIIEGLKYKKKSFAVSLKFQLSFTVYKDHVKVLARRNSKRKQLHLFPHCHFYFF